MASKFSRADKSDTPVRISNERGNNSRRQLLAAATSLFAERGYSGTSIADVAALAGVAKASVLYHFNDKEALWVEAVEMLWSEVDAFYVAHRLTGDHSALNRLERTLELFVRASLNWPAYVRIPFIEGATPSWRSDWLVDHHFASHVRVTDALLRQLQAEGRLRAGSIAHYQALLSSSVNVLIAQAAIWERSYGHRLDDEKGLQALNKLLLEIIVIA